MRIPSWLKRHRSNPNPCNVRPLIIVGQSMADMIEGMDHSGYEIKDCLPCFLVAEWKRLSGPYQ
jgi:hypothetical protein